MKVVVLAAGKGERLKGLVDDVPKPMVCLQGKPILQSNIEWLRDNGFSRIYINLHHLHNVITSYFGDGHRYGVNIEYSFEETLLGTAGAVKKIADTYWDRSQDQDVDFLLIYGDNLFHHQTNLKKVVEFHKTKKAFVTIGLHYKEDVSQSGVVVVDENMAVKEFIEKPKKGAVSSHLVNAGVYVIKKDLLNRLSPGKFYDFARDIFPMLIQEGKKFFSVIFTEGLVAVDTQKFFKEAVAQFN